MSRSVEALARLSLFVSVVGFVGCRASDASKPVPAVAASTAALATTAKPSDADAATDANARPARALPDVRTDWCLDGWRGLDEGTCWLAPDGWDQRASKRLLIYLSGIVPPVAQSPQKENVQRVVAAVAKRAGAVVLLPRGRQGIGPEGSKDWWAWPTSAGDYAAYAASMVASFESSRAKLEAALGRFDRVYLAGSSSGAYFLTALALAGATDVDGFAAASGGSPGLLGARTGGQPKKRPFYVGYATGDTTNGGPKALGAFLRSSGWPVRVAEHPGGHGAREVYLDEAFAFWDAFERGR